MFLIHGQTESHGGLLAEAQTLNEVKIGLREGVRRLRDNGFLEGLDGFDRERALSEQIDALTEDGGTVGPLSDNTMVTVTRVDGTLDAWEPPSTIMRKVGGE